MAATVSDALKDAVANYTPAPSPAAPTKRQRRAQVIRFSAPPSERKAKTEEELKAEYTFDGPDPDDTALEETAQSETQAAPEKVEEASPAAAEVAAPSAPKHSPRLVQMARDFGATAEAIEAATTEELLAFIDGSHKHANRAVPAGTEPAKGKDAPPAADDDALDLGLNDDNSTPEMRRVFEALLKDRAATRAELRELKSQLQPVRQSEEQRRQSEYAAAVDRVFDGLDRPELFGKGSYDQDAAIRRRTVHDSLISNPIPGVPMDKAIAQRVKTLYGAGTAPAASAPATAKPSLPAVGGETAKTREQQWEEGVLEAPTQRKAKPEKGDRAARELFLRLERERLAEAVSAVEADGDEDDSL